jgi:hypothetical protein
MYATLAALEAVCKAVREDHDGSDHTLLDLHSLPEASQSNLGGVSVRIADGRSHYLFVDDEGKPMHDLGLALGIVSH